MHSTTRQERGREGRSWGVLVCSGADTGTHLQPLRHLLDQPAAGSALRIVRVDTEAAAAKHNAAELRTDQLSPASPPTHRRTAHRMLSKVQLWLEPCHLLSAPRRASTSICSVMAGAAGSAHGSQRCGGCLEGCSCAAPVAPQPEGCPSPEVTRSRRLLGKEGGRTWRSGPPATRR